MAVYSYPFAWQPLWMAVPSDATRRVFSSPPIAYSIHIPLVPRRFLPLPPLVGVPLLPYYYWLLLCLQYYIRDILQILLLSHLSHTLEYSPASGGNGCQTKG
jgi:hypothetical protein